MIVKMESDELIILRVQYLVDVEPLHRTASYPIPTRAPTYGFVATMPLSNQMSTILRLLEAPQELESATLQVFKDGELGNYLDLELSLADQSEEIEGFESSRKNSIVVCTQLSVRVHAIIEKILSSEGSDLRRSLFALKQVFQEDKDLVHAFVDLGGLDCLVRIGNVAEYQHYILRALGQVMLYVDGMHGVMKYAPIVQWLYSLIESSYRTVVKTSLKLLLVFVEYTESNCYMLVNAIHEVDKSLGHLPWSNIMRLLKDYDNADTELVIYATSLINKILAGLNDQDSYYDETDLLEQQGMEIVIQRYVSKPGTDLDLLDQFQIYESVLKYEDGELEDNRVYSADNSLRKKQRNRTTDTIERRKSRRHSTGNTPAMLKKVLSSTPESAMLEPNTLDEERVPLTSTGEFNGFNSLSHCNNSSIDNNITPGLRRRRERAERHKCFLKEREGADANAISSVFETCERHAISVKLEHSLSPLGSLNLVDNDSNLRNDMIANDSLSKNHKQDYHKHKQETQLTLQIKDFVIDNNKINESIETDYKVLQNKNQIMKCHYISSCEISPTKKLTQGMNVISIINNGLETNNNCCCFNNIGKSNINYDSKCSTINVDDHNKSQKFENSIMFLTKKNLLMERNATVINGLMKNIKRANESTITSTYITSPITTTLPPIIKNCENDVNCFQNCVDNTTALLPKTHIKNHKTLDKKRYQQQYCTNDTNQISEMQKQKQIFTNITKSRDINLQSKKKKSFCDDISNKIKCSSPTQFKIANASINEQEILLTTTTAPPSTPFSEILDQYPLSLITSEVSAHIPPPPPFPEQWRCTESYNPQSSTTASIYHENERLVKGDLLNISEFENEDKKLLQQLKRDHTVKDLTQKLSTLPISPTHVEDKNLETRIGAMSGLISKAKEGLAKTKIKGEISRSSSIDQELKQIQTESKKSENELHWEELIRNMSRSLRLCDLDFTDLNYEDDKDGLLPRSLNSGVPPPPPPLGGAPSSAPPPLYTHSGYASLPNSSNRSINGSDNGSEILKKNKKTVKLFWKEIREDMIVLSGKTIWDELIPVQVDTHKLEHLFESKAKDLLTKKQQDINKSKEIIILDHKRSNAINIALTKLPPPRAIKAAILKMDQTIMSREGIDKLLNLLPTDEEKDRILEAQMMNPELPLGSAEQFLLTLSSISELAARLKLWAFRLDFDNIEKEIAEPLMDLKQGIEILRNNYTFKCILSTLLSVGTFLNGATVKGFDIEYLSKVPEVKDTVHKHSLLHHLCHMVMDVHKDTTDLYSEIGPVTRASKADFSELAHNVSQLEVECKASWDRLKLIAKHDCATQFKQKLVDFLADCAERIIILQIVHRRVLNRYRKFLLWLGVPQHNIPESRPNEFCRILSEFSLEYRTTRERVQQQIQKKANCRERNKTRGKMIIDTISKFKTNEDCADVKLKELLGTSNNEIYEGISTLRRRRPDYQPASYLRQNEENLTDADDDILESLVKTATKASGTRTVPRERKRTRHADRKSHRRTLKNGLTEEEKKTLTTFISTY